MADVVITIADDDTDTGNDATIAFSGDQGQRDSAWLTVDTGNPDRPKYSVNIIDTGGGLKINLFFADHEMDDPAIGGLLLDYEYADVVGEEYVPQD